MGDATSATGSGRRSVAFTGADCTCGSRDSCLEGHGVLPVVLVIVFFCHGSLMAFSLIN